MEQNKNYIELNELIRDDVGIVWNVATLIFCFLDTRNSFLFSLKLSITISKILTKKAFF